MTAKEYLQQLQSLQHNIEILHERIEKDRARLESTSAPLRPDKVQSSAYGDRFADAIARLADKSLEYQDLLDIYEMLQQRIIHQILDMPDGLQKRVLYERYVNCKAWKVIAIEQHYSEQYLLLVHNNALATFGQLYGPVFYPIIKNF